MIKHKIEIVENVTNVANINPERPYEQVVADCMKDYLEYRKLEEQGLLLKLPCPIGIEVWTIMCGMTGKHPTLFKQSFEYSMIEHFGKAVFLTKEEAEQKLKEMESDTNGKN